MENRGERKLESKIEHKEKGGPEISYHFFYSPHGTAKDVENFEKAFKKSDIYVPEFLGWDEQNKKDYADLSQGKIMPEELSEKYDKDKQTAQFKKWEIIYNSKKPILFADVPFKDKEFNNKWADRFLLIPKARELFETGDFKKSLDKYRSFLEGYAKIQLEREEKTKENLDREIEEFLKLNPDYAKKEKLKVLFGLGIAHTKFFWDLKKEERTVSREFSQISFAYSHFAEAIRKIMSNKELPDETIAKGIVEDELLKRYLEDLTDDITKLMKISRQISSLLTIKDIEKISQNLGRSSLRIDRNTFIKEMEKFGIKLPKSEKEIDEML